MNEKIVELQNIENLIECKTPKDTEELANLYMIDRLRMEYFEYKSKDNRESMRLSEENWEKWRERYGPSLGDINDSPKYGWNFWFSIVNKLEYRLESIDKEQDLCNKKIREINLHRDKDGNLLDIKELDNHPVYKANSIILYKNMAIIQQLRHLVVSITDNQRRKK